MKKFLTSILAILLMSSMAVSGMAADFTPSVEAKPAPEVITQVMPDGTEAIATITDSEGNIIEGLLTGDIIVTSLADSKSESFIEDAAEEQKAVYEEIKQLLASAEGDLVESVFEGQEEFIEQLDKLAEEIMPECDHSDFVVSELFDVTLTGTFEDYLKSGTGNTLKIGFNLPNHKENEEIVAIYKCPGQNWKVNNTLEFVDKNTVSLKFTELCPVAFLTIPVENMIVTDPEVTSPETNPKVPVVSIKAHARRINHIVSIQK